MEIFATSRISIRELDESDLPAFHDLAKDELVCEALEVKPFDLEKSQKHLRKIISDGKMPRRQHFEFAFCDKISGRLIGTGGFRTSKCGKFAEVAGILGSASWKSGLGTEALKGLIEIISKFDPKLQILATCTARNHAAQQLLKKSRFVRDQTSETTKHSDRHFYIYNDGHFAK